jgi:hypothetical protein
VFFILFGLFWMFNSKVLLPLTGSILGIPFSIPEPALSAQEA